MSDPSAMWGGGTYERIAERFAPIHDELVARLEPARAKAIAEGLEIRWDLGDVQALPYRDADFDVASSNFGIMFAPDHEVVARELGRVTRPGGRLGLANWRPNEGLHAIYGHFAPAEGAPDPEEWGSEDRLEELLGNAFEL